MLRPEFDAAICDSHSSPVLLYNCTKVIFYKIINQQVQEELMLPHILESDVYKNAINYRVSPSDLGQASLEYAIQILAQRLKPALQEKYAKLIPTETA